MEYLTVAWRTVTIVALFLAVSLIMGKRHIGELAVFDLVITVTLASVAGADLADPDVPHMPTVLAIILLGGIHFLLSRYILRSRKIGHWVTMDPTIMIQNGVIRWDSLAKLRYSVDELLSHLREKDVFDLSDVEYAVLEPNGALSVLKKADKQTVTLGDAGLKPSPAGLPVPVVLEGRVHRQGLEALGRTARGSTVYCKAWGTKTRARCSWRWWTRTASSMSRHWPSPRRRRPWHTELLASRTLVGRNWD